MPAADPADSPGSRLRAAIDAERPLQVVGTINACCALLAQRAGFRALYLSGAGVANASHGLPDLGMTTLHDVLEDARRITATVDLPLLVDGDTGWGSPLSIQRAVRELTRAGAAGVHFEDQVDAKRCGHRPGKQLVATDVMLDRLRAALDARTDSRFAIMARTDAAAVEGLTAAIDRALAYAATGADLIFAEALTTLDEFARFAAAVDVPVLANITEFGRTPLFSLNEMRAVGVRLVLYPLTAFRAMNAAAASAYDTLRRDGTQKGLLPRLQTRDELYDVLDYHDWEQRLEGSSGPESRP
jgi:methylisocitrate lyase